MKVEHPNAPELSSEDLKELDRLKGIIERAISDGILSYSEYNTIKQTTLENHPSSELLYQELQLYRQLVTEKVKQGVLFVESFE